jgi:AGCS family alanine or glycine:cation symporter
MALLTACNLIAIVLLSPQAVWLLRDYRNQKRQGIKDPTFSADKMPRLTKKLESW